MTSTLLAVACVVLGLAACVLLLCATPRGLVSPGIGLALKASAVLGSLPWDPALRRAKNERDFRTVSRPAKGAISVQDASVAGPDGGTLRVRSYAPPSGTPGATLLFIHGGGWVLGSVEGYDSFARALCLGTGAAVVSVDYRLAPEHPFPAATRDVLAAYRWALAERAAGRLGPKGIFACGDSAGGNLAAVLCAQAAASGLDAPAGCIMLCPVTDLSRMDTESYSRFGKGYLLTKEEMEWFRSLYLPDPADRSDPAASPLLAGGLSGHPRSLVLVAEFDPLRDEGEAYAERLSAAGVAVDCRRMPGMIHDFVVMSRFTPSAGRAIRMIGDFIRSAIPS
jgi:acetyl esterase